MNCPNCAAEMEYGWLTPNKICYMSWAPNPYQFPLPQKDKVELRPTEERPTPFDFMEYRAHICKACKTVVFQYE